MRKLEIGDFVRLEKEVDGYYYEETKRFNRMRRCLIVSIHDDYAELEFKNEDGVTEGYVDDYPLDNLWPVKYGI